jgi:hypothetical protein
MTKITDHFTLEELTISEVAARRGLSNEPPPELLPNLQRVADLLELVRVRLNYQQVIVHSAYRAPEVNEAVGGVKTSAHCKALAADIVAPGYGCPSSVATAIRDTPDLMAVIDQLILEYGWVHVGLADDGKEPRHQLLTKRSAAAPYEVGIVF